MKNISNLTLVTLNNHGGTWNQKSLNEFARDNDKANKIEGAKLTVIKYVRNFLYFVNDEFFTCEEYSFMDQDVMPGFYALGADVIYKNYSCKEINKSELIKYLNNKGLYYIDMVQTNSGGSVEISDLAVKRGGQYEISLTSNSGYQVSSIQINGKEMIRDAKSEAIGGVYKVKNVTSNQEVRVSFEKVANSEITGRVKSGNNGISAKIILTGQSNKILKYEINVSGEKGYKVTVPKGTYLCRVEAEGYIPISKSIVINGSKSIDFSLQQSGFPKTVTVNGKAVSSSLSRWDISNESAGKVYGSYAKGTKMSPLCFAKVGRDFVVEATISYTTDFKDGGSYQTDLMGGFAFSDGNNTNWIVAKTTGYVSTGWKYSTGLIDYEILTYPKKRPVKFAVAKRGEDLYIYFDNVFAKKVKWSEVAPDISANSEVAIGLIMIADKPIIRLQPTVHRLKDSLQIMPFRILP